MAIDYGDARTGVAVSDNSATLTGDAWVLSDSNMQAVACGIAAEAVSRGVSIIVVGYPRNMNGTVGPRAEKSERLAELLRSLCTQDAQGANGVPGVHDAHGVQDTQAELSTPGDLDVKSLQPGVEVVLWDERLTTMSAHRILDDAGKHGKKRKKTIDAVAASLILESYLAHRIRNT